MELNNNVIFKSSNFLLYTCIIFSIFCLYEYYDRRSVDFIEFSIVFFLLSFTMLFFCVKTLKVEKKGITMSYYFRPFLRHYRYRCKNIKAVLCDCGRASADIYIKVERNHPFLIFKNKYLYFPCRDVVQAKDIIYLLNINGVKIKFRGNRDKQNFIKKEIGLI